MLDASTDVGVHVCATQPEVLGHTSTFSSLLECKLRHAALVVLARSGSYFSVSVFHPLPPRPARSSGSVTPTCDVTASLCYANHQTGWQVYCLLQSIINNQCCCMEEGNKHEYLINTLLHPSPHKSSFRMDIFFSQSEHRSHMISVRRFNLKLI